MSIFKDKAIVLKIEKLPENSLLYTFFTYNYWKIRANKKFSKSEKNLDLGYLVDFEIVTKENVSIHKIKNIKIKNEFNLENNKTFYEINLFLEILSFVLNETLDWVENKEIFSLENVLRK